METETDRFTVMRQAMVENQLRTTAVNDPVVIAALRRVPRERFVPAERAGLAYVDITLPLGDGRALNTPMATARLLTEAHPKAGERVLVVGAATGYAAALLAEIGLQVTALDEMDGGVPTPGVERVQGPLAGGWAANAPYDLILVDGAIATVPLALVSQLTDRGRMAYGTIDGGVMRLAIGRRAGQGFGAVAFVDAEAVPLPGFDQPAVFSF